MNVAFNLPSQELKAQFIAEAVANGYTLFMAAAPPFTTPSPSRAL